MKGVGVCCNPLKCMRTPSQNANRPILYFLPKGRGKDAIYLFDSQ